MATTGLSACSTAAAQPAHAFSRVAALALSLARPMLVITVRERVVDATQCAVFGILPPNSASTLASNASSDRNREKSTALKGIWVETSALPCAVHAVSSSRARRNPSCVSLEWTLRRRWPTSLSPRA